MPLGTIIKPIITEMNNLDKIATPIREITGWKYSSRVEKVTDTTEWDCNDMLLHFTIRPEAHYETMDQFLDDYYIMLEEEFPQGRPEKS